MKNTVGFFDTSKSLDHTRAQQRNSQHSADQRGVEAM